MNNNPKATGQAFDPYLTWLGIRDPQRPPNHYRLLGLELFENDPEVIAAAADRQMAYVRTYQAGQQAEHSQRILNELTTAKLCLLKPERKREYDQRLQAGQRPVPTPPQHVAPIAGMAARPMAHAVGNPTYAQPASPLAEPPVVVHSTQRHSVKKNSALQWSILGSLVLAVVVLAVILANKFGANEPAPIAEKSPSAKATTAESNNTAASLNTSSHAESTAKTPPETEAAPINPADAQGSATEPAGVATAPPLATDASQERPGPVKAPLPPATLPGSEQSPASTNATTTVAAAPTSPQPAVTPAPQQPPATAPAPVAAPSSDDPLNSLPTSSGGTPATPPGNPLMATETPPNPLREPANPLAMPNPLDEPTKTLEPPKPAARRAMPSAKEITDNRAQVREVFKALYTAKSATLGKELLKLARESAEKPALMYAAYDEARLVGAALNDLDTVFTAYEEIPQEFAVEQDKDLLETVKAIAKGAATMTPENAGMLLDFINNHFQTALIEQRVDFAEQLLRMSTSFIPRAADKIVREASYRESQKRLADFKTFAPKAAQYKETLARNPDDGEANLELGKFWAFQQGSFERGLPYLAKGSDSEIRAAAQAELLSAPDYVKVGAGWWEVANKLPPDPKAALRVHAAYAYARALPQLKSLERSLAETRINEAFKLFKPTNPEVKEIVKLLLTRSNWKMQWKGQSPDETLGFNMSGSSSSEDYPTWKLLDSMGVGYVVCFRNPERMGGGNFGQGFGGGGFGRRNPQGGKGNNNDNTVSKNGDLTRNVMKIALVASNRIEVIILGGDGKTRNEGTGTPE